MSPATKKYHLNITRLIKADPEWLFDAWTKPELLVQWWGPDDVSCPEAEIDLKVGGKYRIANLMEDKSILWICGTFEVVERPNKLVYTWGLDPELPQRERVCVMFVPKHGETEVRITHSRIASEKTAISHEHGWNGCLDGLAEFAAC